ncbi:MAG: hypothetical protein ABEJ78_06180 [Haloferacaceae archaeon]
MSDAAVRPRTTRDTSAAVGGDGWRRRTLAAVALLAAAVPFSLRLGRNVPGTAVASLPGSYDAAVVATTLALALVAVGLAVGTPDRVERVALSSLAAFAPLAFAADAAYLPAAGAVTAAGGVVAWRRLARETPDRARIRTARLLFGGAAVAGVGCSLGATTGLVPVVGRRVGTLLALLAAAAAGVAVGVRAVDWAAGAVTASLVYLAGTTAPYVAGAVALVAGGVVGASLPLLAAGVGGLAAASVGSLRRGSFVPACGALVVLVGGVPVTVSRALAVVLGVAFVLGGDRA